MLPVKESTHLVFFEDLISGRYKSVAPSLKSHQLIRIFFSDRELQTCSYSFLDAIFSRYTVYMAISSKTRLEPNGSTIFLFDHLTRQK